MGASNFKETAAYKKAFDLAMRIFVISKAFPKEETYSLTDQIRRSSRSVCANLAESFRKRRYPAHFILKCTDSDAENSEIQVWLDFSLKCNYLPEEEYHKLTKESEEVGRLINHMINYPERY